MYEIEVRHSLDAAHRVVGHTNSDGSPGKCARLHGHTYGFVARIAGDFLDETGFLIDFGDVKRLLDEWDHRTLLWEQDGLVIAVGEFSGEEHDGVVRLDFNPTAENMARNVAERLLELDDGLRFVEIEVSETPKTVARWRASR